MTAQDNKYVHFSIDDVYLWLREIDGQAEVYASLFDHPRLACLKSFHDRYGAVVTFNCFYSDEPAAWNLGQMTTRFKEEFAAHAHWLRLAFHANTRLDNYNDCTVEEARAHYQNAMEALRIFAAEENIDTLGRTHYFSGNLVNARAWREASPGARGFLTSDDSRDVDMYLQEPQRAVLKEKGAYYDENEHFYFLKSMPRLEKWADPVADLSAWSRDPAYAGHMQALAFFTHEQCWTSELETKLDHLFRWAKANEYEFAFPMDRIPGRA
ncbi:hypothetical protein [Paenibacillus sp. YN15]|uniref:hypothetical protein n=1 Tax=Paenibacillus sp. YN15 TaxID=1742774 RepID=UPI000DCB156A|nr:hypothetical protein [Paenibacillus sp. YN15]RAV01285.1 hypothetical protein DQG13_12990 [Paenibacillus sp. YN15]